MVARRIDRVKVKDLHDKGMGVVEIARELGASKGSVSKILKKMNNAVAIVAATDEAAPIYKGHVEAEINQLFKQVDKTTKKLDWIENEISPKKDADFRTWNDQWLKFGAEIRKLLTAINDAKYKMFQKVEMVEVLQIIDEEISHESVECQKRIAERIRRRMGVRFPTRID